MHLEHQSQNSITSKQYHMEKLNSLGLEVKSNALLEHGDKPDHLWKRILQPHFSTSLQ